MNSLFSAGTRSRWSARSHRPAPAVAILAALAACVLGACQAAPAAPAPTSGSAAKPATAATTAPTAASGTTAAAKPAAATPATAAPPFVVARDVQLLNGDPHREYSDDALLLLPMLYEQLVRVDPKDISKFIPDAADRWTVSDDATSYTFTLHAGMKFGSGNPVAAEDVKFSLERLKNLKGPPSFLMDGVKEVAAVDAATVRITLEAPDAAFLSKLASGYAGVVDSKLARDNGALSDATAKDADKAAEFFGGRS
jgi:peptide/nickel transport system substrate-binding protein